MSITFVGNSKEARDNARWRAIDYLKSNRELTTVSVYKRKWNYHKEKEEIVKAGYVYRRGKLFAWMPFDDRSSGTLLTDRGESVDDISVFSLYVNKNETLEYVKTIVEARKKAIWLIQDKGLNNIKVSNIEGTHGIVSKSKDPYLDYVWIKYSLRGTQRIEGQYVLKRDGTLGRRL